MEIKAVPISYRSNGGRKGIVGRRGADSRRIAEGFSIGIALVTKGLGVGIGCKQVRERHHAHPSPHFDTAATYIQLSTEYRLGLLRTIQMMVI